MPRGFSPEAAHPDGWALHWVVMPPHRDPATLARRIVERGLVAIVRGAHTPDELVSVAGALWRGGIHIVEITLDSAHARDGIRRVGDTFGEDMLLGAGTVRSPADVDRALEAGAEFLVSPALLPEVVAAAHDRSCLILPGVLTPSEIERAASAGCRLLKLFPAGSLGASYLRALRGPLSDISFMPTGGIGSDDLTDFVAAGAAAFGIGSALVRDVAIDDGELERIEAAAGALVALLAEARAAVGG